MKSIKSNQTPKPVFPDLKLQYEGDTIVTGFVIPKKDPITLNSVVEQGFSLHLYRGDFGIYYRIGNQLVEIPVEASVDPTFEYQVNESIINKWLNLESMKYEIMASGDFEEFKKLLMVWAFNRKIRLPLKW